MHVDPVGQVQIGQQRIWPAEPGNRHDMRQGHVVLRLGAGARSRHRNVRYAGPQAIVDDASRRNVDGGMPGSEAATLVNRHIDQRGTGVPGGQQLARDRLRRGASGD